MQHVKTCDASPVSDQEFSTALAQLPDTVLKTQHIAVAVSGGVDSMALVLLLQNYCTKHAIKLTALLVDHHLRAGSTQDIQNTAEHLKNRGITHHILNWDHTIISTSVQHQARQARYALMLDWCQEQGISSLFLGHHADDQIETFWIRLIAQSGLDGLSCMADIRKDEVSGIFIVRPMLQFKKTRLIATCEAEKQTWVEDPTNKKMFYTRNEIRSNLDHYPLSEDLTLRTLQLFRALRTIMDNQTRTAYKNTAKLHQAGYAVINFKDFQTRPKELQRRLLQGLTQSVAGRFYPYRTTALDTALNNLGKKKIFTFGGCIFEKKGKTIYISREIIHIETGLLTQSPFIWDNRFKIHTDLPDLISEEVTLTVLAGRGLSTLDKSAQKRLKPLYKKYPRYLKQALPVLEKSGKIIAIPHLDYFDTQVFGNNNAFSITFFAKNSLFHDDIEIV